MSSELTDDDLRAERLNRVLSLELVRSRFSPRDMLVSRKKNKDGYHTSHMYKGGDYDGSVYELIVGGWDHEHCYICSTSIEEDDEWYESKPPNEIGVCTSCFRNIFGKQRLLLGGRKR